MSHLKIKVHKFDHSTTLTQKFGVPFEIIINLIIFLICLSNSKNPKLKQVMKYINLKKETFNLSVKVFSTIVLIGDNETSNQIIYLINGTETC